MNIVEYYKSETIIPKYTSYEIVCLINKELSKSNIDEICKKNNIDKETLEVILKGPKILSLEMYKIVSKILKKSIKELTKIDTIDVKTSFRKSKKCSIDDIKKDLDLANMLFNEIIINAKLNAK
jgi:hypothetical protein